MPRGNTSNSENIGLYLFNCQDHPVRVRTEFRASNRKSTKKTSEDKAESQHRCQLSSLKGLYRIYREHRSE